VAPSRISPANANGPADNRTRRVANCIFFVAFQQLSRQKKVDLSQYLLTRELHRNQVDRSESDQRRVGANGGSRCWLAAVRSLLGVGALEQQPTKSSNSAALFLGHWQERDRSAPSYLEGVSFRRVDRQREGAEGLWSDMIHRLNLAGVGASDEAPLFV
jgi:hypothetical protein